MAGEGAVFAHGEAVAPVAGVYGPGVDAYVVLFEGDVLPELQFHLKDGCLVLCVCSNLKFYLLGQRFGVFEPHAHRVSSYSIKGVQRHAPTLHYALFGFVVRLRLHFRAVFVDVLLSFEQGFRFAFCPIGFDFVEEFFPFG